MRTILLSLIACSLWAWPSGYTYGRSITIDHTKVTTPGQTNLPVVISATVAELKTVANGGHVQNTTTCCGTGLTVPADLIFTDTDQTTVLNWDIEAYSATTGAIVVWVRVPSTSPSTDKVVYMFYGNSGVTTFQNTYTATYDANTKGRWHFSDVANLVDSTANVSACTNHSTTNGATTKIDGSLHLVKASSQYVGCGVATATQITDNITISGWIWSDDAGSVQAAIDNEYRQGTAKGIAIFINNVSTNINVLVASGTLFDAKNFTATVNDSAWHYIVTTFAAGVINLYIDGTAQTPQTSITVTALGYGTENLQFGANAALSAFYSGNLDEITISNVVRAADWISTSYTNQNAPSSFSTIGSEQTQSAKSFPMIVGLQ